MTLDDIIKQNDTIQNSAVNLCNSAAGSVTELVKVVANFISLNKLLIEMIESADKEKKLLTQRIDELTKTVSKPSGDLLTSL